MNCDPVNCKKDHHRYYSQLLVGEVYFVYVRVVSTYSICKELRDPISGARNPVRDEFDNSLHSDIKHFKMRNQQKINKYLTYWASDKKYLDLNFDLKTENSIGLIVCCFDWGP